MNAFKSFGIILFIIIVSTISCFSQENNMMLSAYVNYNMPMGTAADNYKSSVGFQAQFEYLITEEIGMDITAGYTPWNFENAPSVWKFSIIPVLIGGRYYFTAKSMSSYVGFDVGMYNTSIKKEVEKTNEPKFGFSFLGGTLYPMGDYLYLNTYLSYTRISTSGYVFSYLAINAGVSFTF
ncbi:MAG: DUF3575 domain-containing protein [Bacteroidetes bacterium]|nr:MAG: DUF3575 domain-containing protein [Bacteroidota bacterium]